MGEACGNFIINNVLNVFVTVLYFNVVNSILLSAKMIMKQ